MKRLSILFVLALLLCASAYGQTGTIIGCCSATPNPVTATILQPATLVIGATNQFSPLSQLQDLTANVPLPSNCISPLNNCSWASSNTGVATITQTGLATAVSSGSATITYTNTTGASPVIGTALLTVSPVPQFNAPIPPCSPCILPPGTNGTTYGPFTFAAVGGVTPYTYSITSGSFTACGLTLNGSTGVLTGTAATNACTATVEVTDSSAIPLHAFINVSLTVTSTSMCGPPAYLCSPSSTTVIQTPTPPISTPSSTGGTATTAGICSPGSANGSGNGCYNSVGYDTSITSFGVDPITRLTDQTMVSGFSLAPTPSQGDNDIGSNCNARGTTPGSTFTTSGCQSFGTYFITLTGGGCPYVEGIQVVSGVLKVVAPLVGIKGLSNVPAHCGLFSWSHTNPQVTYNHPSAGSPVIYSTTWTWDGTVGHTVTFVQSALYNLQSLCPLPGSFTTQWASSVSTDITDKYFTVGLSNSGGQNTGNYLIFLDSTSSPATCMVYNTGDPAHSSVAAPFGTVSCSGANCPSSGAMAGFAPGCQFTIHDVFALQNAASGFGYIPLSTGGQTTGHTCVTNKPPFQPYTPALLQASVPGTVGGKVFLGGHYATGYNNIGIINNPYLFSVPASTVSSATAIAPFATLSTNCDFHFSNQNTDAGDDNPSVGTTADNNYSTSGTTSTYASPWMNELIISFPATKGTRTAGTIVRAGHTFTLGPGNGINCNGNSNVGPFDPNANFSAQYSIGALTQDGAFFWYASSMLGQLGTDFNGNKYGGIFGVLLQ